VTEACLSWHGFGDFGWGIVQAVRQLQLPANAHTSRLTPNQLADNLQFMFGLHDYWESSSFKEEKTSDKSNKRKKTNRDFRVSEVTSVCDGGAGTAMSSQDDGLDMKTWTMLSSRTTSKGTPSEETS